MRKEEQRRIGGYPVAGKSVLIGFIIAVGAIAAFFLVAIPQMQESRSDALAHGTTIATHEHVTIKLFNSIDNTRSTLPAGIGIEEKYWHDHSLDSLGANNMAPIHTHDNSGIVHIESIEQGKTFTVGNLLKIWGEDTSRIDRITTRTQTYDASDLLSEIPLRDSETLSIYVR